MSQLIKLLRLVESWVQQYNSDELAQVKMRPGLTVQQIEEKLSGLPYKLPREIVELYQWHNGGHESFLPSPDGGYDLQVFFYLDEAISTAMDWNDGIFPNRNAFPLFSVEDVIYWTVGSEEQQELAPIYSSDDAELPSHPDATSLTAFLENNVKRLRFKWKIDEEIPQDNNSLEADRR
ncbi:hypothetical protein ACSQ6I_21325 [Anabaena sp. WFMT]|uniref:hypothetical protein n=1 Tax=Anabaena sp. WFMT TaxID=3449730 RepID=UPI003F1F99C7